LIQQDEAQQNLLNAISQLQQSISTESTDQTEESQEVKPKNENRFSQLLLSKLTDAELQRVRET